MAKQYDYTDAPNALWTGDGWAVSFWDVTNPWRGFLVQSQRRGQHAIVYRDGRIAFDYGVPVKVRAACLRLSVKHAESMR